VLVQVAELENVVELQHVVFLAHEGDVVLDVEIALVVERVFELVGVLIQSVRQDFVAQDFDALLWRRCGAMGL
jgi:hypothetical protein